jgi:hypothetical protein
MRIGFNADPDPDLTLYLNADLDPGPRIQANADPDSGFVRLCSHKSWILP